MARRDAGLTQQQLAELAATSQAAVSAYESGRRSPSVDTLCRLLAAAGFEVRMRLAPPDTHTRPPSPLPSSSSLRATSTVSDLANVLGSPSTGSMPELDAVAISPRAEPTWGALRDHRRDRCTDSRPARASHDRHRHRPGAGPENLERLARVFEELEAGLFTADEAGTWFPRTPVDHGAQFDTLYLMTSLGPLDVVFVPDGATTGYSELATTAQRTTLVDQPVMVISVSTWEALKQATGRAKDLEHLDRYDESRRNR